MLGMSTHTNSIVALGAKSNTKIVMNVFFFLSYDDKMQTFFGIHHCF